MACLWHHVTTDAVTVLLYCRQKDFAFQTKPFMYSGGFCFAPYRRNDFPVLGYFICLFLISLLLIMFLSTENLTMTSYNLSMLPQLNKTAPCDSLLFPTDIAVRRHDLLRIWATATNSDNCTWPGLKRVRNCSSPELELSIGNRSDNSTVKVSASHWLTWQKLQNYLHFYTVSSSVSIVGVEPWRGQRTSCPNTLLVSRAKRWCSQNRNRNTSNFSSIYQYISVLLYCRQKDFAFQTKPFMYSGGFCFAPYRRNAFPVLGYFICFFSNFAHTNFAHTIHPGIKVYLSVPDNLLCIKFYAYMQIYPRSILLCIVFRFLFYVAFWQIASRRKWWWWWEKKKHCCSTFIKHG